MASKTEKTAAPPGVKRGRAEKRRRVRKRSRLTLLDPFLPDASPGEVRIVKAISESTKDFTTGRYEP